MALFEFDMRVASADLQGYYYTRWDQATPITLTAENKQAAVNKAVAAMGEPRSGRYWTVITDKIRDVKETTNEV